MGRLPRRKGQRLLFGLVGLLLLATIIIFAGSQLHLSFPEHGNNMGVPALGFSEDSQSKQDFAVRRASVQDERAQEGAVVTSVVN